MRIWRLVLVAVLAQAGAAPSLAADTVEFTLEVVGSAPSGDALLVRERNHPPEGKACPPSAYPRVKGSCNLGVILHVCDVKESSCEPFEVYAFPREGARTSEPEAAATLGKAKKAAQGLGIVLAESGRPVPDGVPDDLLSTDGLPGLSLEIVRGDESVDVKAKVAELAVPVLHLGHPMEGDWELSTFHTQDRSAVILYSRREDGSEGSVSVVGVRPLAAHFLELRGNARYAKASWELAARDFAAAVERDPKRATARLGLGLTQLRLGKRADALSSMRRALEASTASGDPVPAILEPSIAGSP